MKTAKRIIATPPGSFLKGILEEFPEKEKQLRLECERYDVNIAELLNGKQEISQGFASKIAKVIGVSETAIVNLEKEYRANLAKHNEKKQSFLSKIACKPKYKFFFCSDIHGYKNALIVALRENGFDIRNKRHILVVAGDVFDRGDESALLYEMLADLEEKKRAIILAGNHDSFFLEFLQRRDDSAFNFIHNGLDSTIKSFLDEICDKELLDLYNRVIATVSTDNCCDSVDKYLWRSFQKKASVVIRKQFPLLVKWLKDRPMYLELENTVATHGRLDEVNWRNPEDWNECLWVSPEESGKMKNPTGKLLLVGHINARDIREQKEGKRFCGTLDDLHFFHSPYHREDENIIYLDSCTSFTERVNIVVIKDRYL